MNRATLLAALLLTLTPAFSTLRAGDPGYASSVRRCSSCADSKFQTPRLHQLLPERHDEDRSRYNAAPCCGEILRVDPYLIKTVIVSKKRIPHYSYDRFGNRRCHRVLTTTYKAIYSDGSCQVWYERG